MILSYRKDSLNIHYMDEGNGEIVLVLHGWGANVTLYQSIIDMLSPHVRVIAPDLPGFGKSSEPSFAYSVADFADFIIAFLSELGIKTLSLIGHSHGGRIALELAARDHCPFEIQKIVLLDSAGIIPKKTLKQKGKIRIYRCAKRLLAIPPIPSLLPNALGALQKKMGSADYNAASPVMRESLVKAVNTDMRDKMPRIRVPTLLVWGEKDTATPLSDARIMESLIPDAGLVVLGGAGHYSYLDSPVLFQRVLFSFFNISEGAY